MWLASRYFSHKARGAFREVRSTVGHVYANLQESIDGVRTTQSFGRERTNASQFEATNQANVTASVRAEDRRRVLDAGMDDFLGKRVFVKGLHGSSPP